MAMFSSDIHIFSYRNIHYLFNGKTLKVYELTDDEVEVLNNAIKHPEKDLKVIKDNHQDLFDYLIKEGIIREEGAIGGVDDSRHEISMTQDQPITCVELEVANDCNMRCRYCYSEDGTYGCKKEWMTAEVAKRCVDFLFENCGDAHELSIVFFGGEPLLNFPVISTVADYANEKAKKEKKNILYSITTNATLLTNQVIEFLNKNHVYVTISIDGPEQVHDKYRIFENGQGSYHAIKPKILNFLAKYEGTARARATVSNHCIELMSIENHFDDLGFQKSTLSFVDTNRDSEMYIPSSRFGDICAQLERTADKYLEQLFSGEMTSNTIYDSAIGSLYSKIARRKPCGAGSACVAFTASGDIYPCHRFSNLEGYKLGDCFYGWNNPMRDSFTGFEIGERNICMNCYMKGICGGGCLHTAVMNTGTIHTPSTHYCDIYKKVLELAIYIYDQAKKHDPQIFEKRFSALMKALEKVE